MWRLALVLLLIPIASQAQVLNPPPIAVQDIIQIAVPVSGDTVATFPGVTVLLINTTSLVALLTVTAPPNPADCQRWMIASGAAVTVLNIGGGNIKGAGTGLSVNGYARFIYSATAGAWFRTG